MTPLAAFLLFALFILCVYIGMPMYMALAITSVIFIRGFFAEKLLGKQAKKHLPKDKQP